MNSVKPPTFQGHVDELELWPMTLIVALFNEQEIVFAADSMISTQKFTRFLNRFTS